MSDFITYAPPMGLEGYRKAVIDETFEGCRPDGYVDAVATSGGTGASTLPLPTIRKSAMPS